MKENAQQMIDERIQFFQKWLTTSSSHQSRDSQEFINKLLYLVDSDKLTKKIFIKNLVGLFQSRQSNLKIIFQFCLKNNQAEFQKQICQFLTICFNKKNELFLSKEMQTYLIHNIWKEKMRKYVQICKIQSIQIIQFLSLKMRSLNAYTRYEAINALFQIVQLILQGYKFPLANNFHSYLPKMIEKQNYGKQVCYYKGVLLQILQDEYSHIKKRGIQLLGKAQSFFDTNMIRPLILYMLNDEHQIVRQTCLVVLSQIPELDIEKQDLSALLVCLKQNHSLMRSYTYQNLSHINITSSQDFKLIMNRLFSILSNRTEDKKKIYIVCSKLGKKYPNFVLSNLDSIYNFNDNQQPNWKAIGYRARLITVAAIGKQKWPVVLPKYFANHYLYMRDVLLYAFEQKNFNYKTFKDINEQTEPQSISHQISINLILDWQLYQYVKATQYITHGFLKSIFQIILRYIEETKLLKNIKEQFVFQILQGLQKLQVMYDISSSKTIKQGIIQLVNVIKSKCMNNLKKYLIKIKQNEIWSEFQKVQGIIFKVSSTDKTKIVISNRPEILKRSFIQFSNNFHQNSNQSEFNGQVGYLRMSQVDFEQINDKMCFYKLKFKCNKIKCLILFSHPPQQYITHTFILENWTNKITN